MSEPRLGTRSLDMAGLGDAVRDEACVRAPLPVVRRDEESEHVVDARELRRWDDPDRRAVAAPTPIFWSLADPRTHRIENDVSAALEEMRVFDDRLCVVPSLKDMPRAVVSRVVALRVGPVEVAHAGTSCRL